MIKAYRYTPNERVTIITETAQLTAHLAEKASGLLWVDFQAPDDAEIECLLECFQLHPLTVEDCILPNMRPKLELFSHYCFLIAHGIGRNAGDGNELEPQELNMCLGENFVLTIHAEPFPSITRDQSRIERASPIITRTPDYLAYAILDSLLETFFPVIDELNERIDRIEEQMLQESKPSYLKEILVVQSEVMKLRRAMTPQREVLAQLHRGESQWIAPANYVYFRDLYDQLLRMSDLTDGCREVTGTALEAYAMLSSNKLNQIMKVLTIVATIMLPLTVITGIYGMNFQHMPELSWRWGYPMVWLFMISLVVGMFYYMKRRQWL